MKCGTAKFDIMLMPDSSVHVVFRCLSKYEASILFHEMAEKAKAGHLIIDLETEMTTEK